LGGLTLFQNINYCLEELLTVTLSPSWMIIDNDIEEEVNDNQELGLLQLDIYFGLGNFCQWYMTSILRVPCEICYKLQP